MEIKFNWLDAIVAPLVVAIIAAIIAGIILILIQYCVNNEKCFGTSTPPPPIVKQLKELQNPNTPFAIAMWINNEPGITQFTTEDKVVLHYRVSDLSPDKTAYFSLFNVSPTGELSQLQLNKPIKGDNIYSVPEHQTPLTPDAPLLEIVPQLVLEKGLEYFRAIVTLDEIEPEKLMTAPKKALEQTTWGTESLTVQVVP